MRRPAPEVLVGGVPLRILRLTSVGVATIDAWGRGRPVGRSSGAQALARRLLDAGMALPKPGTAPHPGAADAAIVIPVKDDARGLEATLGAVRSLAGPIVVVDDGSLPPLSRPEGGRVTLIHRRTSGGPAAARNAGWKACHQKIVVFVDAGCEPAAGWLEALLGHFADPTLAAVAPRIVPVARSGTPAWLGRYEATRSPLDLGPRPAAVKPGAPVAFVPSATLAVRRSALEAVGGFDETLRYGEDVDLVWRLVKGGWGVRYDPAATVTHPTRTTAPSWALQRFNYGRSAASLATKHGHDVAPVAVSPWSATAWALAACGHPASGLALAVATSTALARRVGPDRRTARMLWWLSVVANLRAGLDLTAAVRRAWLPPTALAVLAGGVLGSSRVVRRVGCVGGAALSASLVADWVQKPSRGGRLTWAVLRLADDLSYQAGVWAGVAQCRSATALWPRR